MLLFYNIGIRIYYLLILISSPFNSKAKKWISGRKDNWQRLKNNLPDSEIYWFHCASLGEFEQGKPLMLLLKERQPEIKILVTFFSPSGYEIKKDDKIADLVVYLPLDTASNAKKFIEITKPKKVFFVKYEFWYHYINQLNKQKIPIYIIAAVFRNEQIFFKAHGGFFRKILKKCNRIFVQNKLSENLLKKIGLSKVTIAPDTRFDKVLSN